MGNCNDHDFVADILIHDAEWEPLQQDPPSAAEIGCAAIWVLADLLNCVLNHCGEVVTQGGNPAVIELHHLA
jgi:hypothetical protein